MLKALADYALSRHLVSSRPGYRYKSLRAYIHLTPEGEFLGLLPAPQLSDRSERHPGEVLCPDIGLTAEARKCSVPVETASILFCLTKKDLPQHRFFLEALEEGQKAEPLLGSCLKALTQDTTLSRMQDAFRRSPYQNKEFFSFRVGETAVELTPAFRRWWEGFYERENRLSARVLQRCLITGELTSPPLNYGRLRLSWPAKDPLYSLPLFQYNRDAYFSYGLRQAHNASMDGRHVEIVSAALTVLIRRAPQLAGSRLVSWHEKPSPHHLSFRKVLDSQPLAEFSGEHSNHFFLLILSDTEERMWVRAFLEGDEQEIASHVRRWHRETQLLSPAGEGMTVCPPLPVMFSRLISPSTAWERQQIDRLMNRMDRELTNLAPRLWDSILMGTPLPDAVAERALEYITLRLGQGPRRLPDLYACMWLKVWLMRRLPTPELFDEANQQSAGYQSGRLAALAVSLIPRDRDALRLLETCRLWPAVVFEKLPEDCRRQLSGFPAVERLRGESILDDILTHLKCRGVPPILEERARAVLGFYQQSVVQLRCSSIDTDRR